MNKTYMYDIYIHTYAYVYKCMHVLLYFIITKFILTITCANN